ncbi:MAG: hypothetical protein ACTSRZ_10360 [Promethearchaeota archaeon]
MLKKTIVISKGQNIAGLMKKSLEIFNKKTNIFTKDAKAFIKIDLSIPEGFPTITSQELLFHLINNLLSYGISKIFIGGISFFGISSQYIWDSMGYNMLLYNKKIKFIPLEKLDSLYKENGISDIIKENSALQKPNFENIANENLQNADSNKADSNNINNIKPKDIKNSSEEEGLYNKFLKKFDVFISIMNLSADPIFTYSSAICDMVKQYIFADKALNQDGFSIFSEDCNEPSIIATKYLECLNLDNGKIPDLIITDMRTICDKIGPLIYSDSQFINTDLILFSNDPIASDIAIEKIVKSASKDNFSNPILRKLQKMAPNIIPSLDSSELADMVLIAQLQDKSSATTTIDSKSKYINNSYKLEINKITAEQIPKTKIIGIESLENIFPEKIHLRIGKISNGLKRALYNLVHLIKTACIKDIENIDDIYILAGSNPPDPPEYNPKDIKQQFNTIIFGDEAIIDTEERDFRFIKKRIIPKTEEELEMERIRYQSKLRDQLIEWEAKMEETKNRIMEQFKNNTEKREKALNSLELKYKKFIQKNQNKYDKFIKSQQKKHQKSIEKSKIIKYKLNTRVLEIPSKIPNPYNYLEALLEFIGKEWLPTLTLWNNFIAQYYDRVLIMKNYESFKKERDKKYKSLIKKMNSQEKSKKKKKTENED